MVIKEMIPALQWLLALWSYELAFGCAKRLIARDLGAGGGR